MTNLEHYFENLLYYGEDIKGEANKNALTEEQQKSVEQCAQYVIYSLFGTREHFDEWINREPASPWHRVEDEVPEPNIQCLVRDDDNNCAVGYYRQDARAWDSPFFGWVERDDEYYEDGDLCRIGKVVAWMPIEPPRDDA